MDSQEIRAKTEEVLRSFVTFPIESKPGEDVFLVIKSPNGNDIEFREEAGEIEMRFGMGGECFSFNTDSDIEDDIVDEKEVFKDLLKTTLDVIGEKKFSAQYKKFFVRFGGFFEDSEFEALSKLKEFESMSWNGKYTRALASQ